MTKQLLMKCNAKAHNLFCEYCERTSEHEIGKCSNCSKVDGFMLGAKWMESYICQYGLQITKEKKEVKE